MDNNDELKKVLEKIGDVNPTEEQLDTMKKVSEGYSDKSEDEIFFEIIRLNEKMEEAMDPEEYGDLMERLEEIRPLLDQDQIERLDKVLEVLKGE